MLFTFHGPALKINMDIQQLKSTLENDFKQRNNRNLCINVLFTSVCLSAPKVLKSSSQISQNVRKQLGLKLYRYKNVSKH